MKAIEDGFKNFFISKNLFNFSLIDFQEKQKMEE